MFIGSSLIFAKGGQFSKARRVRSRGPSMRPPMHIDNSDFNSSGNGTVNEVRP
jgi:hypothetical protein